MPPLVSVVLPTFNRTQLLPRALHSIGRQTMRNLEAIVVNDGGIDVAGIVGRYPFARLISHEYNAGLAAARNTGIAHALGKYIAYLDDDDIWLPRHLKVCTDVLEVLTHINAAYTDAYVWVDEKYLVPQPSTTWDKDLDREVEKLTITALVHERSIVIDKNIWFDKTMRRLEDWDFIIRFTRSNPVQHITDNTVIYSKRTSGGQLTQDTDEMLEAKQTINERYKKGIKR